MTDHAGACPRRLVLAGLTAVLLGGCTLTFDRSERAGPPVTPSTSAGEEVWDLRVRPTAERVGLDADRDVVFFETGPRHPRPVAFLLPEGRTVRLPKASLVSFDRIGSVGLAASLDPLHMDARSGPIPVDEAHELVRAVLADLGTDTTRADQWLDDVRRVQSLGAEPGQRVSGGGATELGYLDVGVEGVFDPADHSDTAFVKLHANFVQP